MAGAISRQVMVEYGMPFVELSHSLLTDQFWLAMFVRSKGEPVVKPCFAQVWGDDLSPNLFLDERR
jgi:hypothetical protein